MRVDDEEVVFDVYKEPIVNSQYKDLCMINVSEGEKCGVVNSQKTSSNYLIERPKMNPLFPNMMKDKVERDVDLESANSRG